ncbi:VOC family protein [Bythopirellula polymerisocia]|uniref:Putative lyase n=1 Tax=Bythopirellula polymerisocia TaxID=2528003 RepID=A0A5C6CYY5_9BACT|nr:VOC family protein [Bythopirellula polymerisocia]TWU27859.1 putative lyase [Bythopirellula polymerisocia]
MIQTIDHVNLVVRDLTGMTAFYRDVLGCQLTKEVSISGPWIDEVVGLSGVEGDVVYLDLPEGPRIELIAYRKPPGVEPSEENAPNLFGLRHMAFRVTDIDRLVAKLQTAGVKFQSEVKSVPDSQVTYVGGVRKRLVYFRDPEANLLEFCEYR